WLRGEVLRELGWRRVAIAQQQECVALVDGLVAVDEPTPRPPERLVPGQLQDVASVQVFRVHCSAHCSAAVSNGVFLALQFGFPSYPSRSSKPAGRSSPPLGWFDSIAAPWVEIGEFCAVGALARRGSARRGPGAG